VGKHCLFRSRLRRELEAEGVNLPPRDEQATSFDNNVITPGTEFMYNLSVALKYYIADRLQNDPGWRNVREAGFGLDGELRFRRLVS
jgi:5'-3' exoribonuclease 2